MLPEIMTWPEAAPKSSTSSSHTAGGTGKNLIPSRLINFANFTLSLTIWHYQDGVISHWHHWLSTHPARRSGQRSEMRHSVLWENWQNKPLEKYFQRFYEPILLYILIYRKALTSWTETSAPHNNQWPLPKCVLHCISLFTRSHIHWCLPHTNLFNKVPSVQFSCSAMSDSL